MNRLLLSLTLLSAHLLVTQQHALPYHMTGDSGSDETSESDDMSMSSSHESSSSQMGHWSHESSSSSQMGSSSHESSSSQMGSSSHESSSSQMGSSSHESSSSSQMGSSSHESSSSQMDSSSHESSSSQMGSSSHESSSSSQMGSSSHESSSSSSSREMSRSSSSEEHMDDLLSAVARHVISNDDADGDDVMERARQVLVERGLHERHSPDGDILGLLLGQDQRDNSEVDGQLVERVMRELGLGGHESELMGVIREAVGGETGHADSGEQGLLDSVRSALSGAGRDDVLHTILAALDDFDGGSRSSEEHSRERMDNREDNDREEIMEAIEEAMEEQGREMDRPMEGETEEEEHIRLLIHADPETREGLVKMVLMQTHDPEELIHMVLWYMFNHTGENALKGAIAVLDTVFHLAEEMHYEDIEGLYRIITEVALHPEMSYNARGHLFAFMVEAAYASDENQDLASMRHFVENSFANADQSVLLNMLDNITMTSMLERYADMEAQRNLAMFLIRNMEDEPRSVELVRMQIDLLLHLSLGFYVDMLDEVYGPTYADITAEVLPTLTDREMAELVQLMVRQALESKVGEMAHASFLEYFLSQQTPDTLDVNATREAMRFVAYTHFDTMHPGISDNDVIRHLINRAIDIDLSRDTPIDDNSMLSGLIHLSLTPHLKEEDFDEVVNTMISFVVNNTEEAEVLQMVVHHLLGSRANEETKDLVQLLVDHVGEVEHSQEERDVIIRALTVQAMREHFGAPGAQAELLEYLVDMALEDAMDRHILIVTLVRHAAASSAGMSNRDDMEHLVEYLITKALHHDDSRDELMAHLLRHIKMEGNAHVQRELLHMLLKNALPDAHEIIRRLSMGHSEDGDMLRELLEHALMSRAEVESMEHLDRDTLALIVLHLLTNGGVEKEDGDTVEMLMSILMDSRGNWEYDFLKNAILHSLLHELGDRDMGHDDDDMWKWMPPRPCRITSRSGEVLHSEMCEGGAQCLMQLRDVVVNDTFIDVTFCAYSTDFFMYHACEVSVGGELVGGDMTHECGEDDQCAVGPLSVSLNHTQAEVTLCLNTLQRFGAAHSVLDAACKVEDDQKMTMEQRRCPMGYSCNNGPFPAMLPSNRSAHAYICQKDDMSGDSIIRHLLEELQMMHGGSREGHHDDEDMGSGRDDMDRTTPGPDGGEMRPTPTSLPEGVYMSETDKAYLKYIVLNTFLVERAAANHGNEEEHEMQIDMIRAMLEEAVASEAREGRRDGEHDDRQEFRYSHDEIREGLTEALEKAYHMGQGEELMTSLLMSAGDQRTEEMGVHMIYYIISGMMGMKSEKARHEALGHVVGFISKNENEEARAYELVIVISMLLSEEVSPYKEVRMDAIRYMTHVFMMIPDEHERHEALQFMFHIIRDHNIYVERQIGLHAMLSVLEEKHTSEDRIHTLLMSILSQQGEARTALLNSLMDDIREENATEREMRYMAFLMAVMSIPSEEERHSAVGVIIDNLAANMEEDEEGSTMMFTHLIQLTLMHGMEGGKALVYIIQKEMQLEEPRRNESLTFIMQVIHAHENEREQEEGVRIFNAVLMGENPFADMEEFMRHLAEGGDARRDAIMSMLAHAYEIYETDEDESGHMFAWVVGAVMSQHSREDQVEGLAVIAYFIQHLESEEHRSEIFAYFVQVILRQPQMEMETGVWFLLHMVMDGGEGEPAANIAYLITTIAMVEGEYERQRGLATVFAIIASDFGENMEEQAFEMAIAHSGDTRRRVITEVLLHAHEVAKTDLEHSSKIFIMVVDSIMDLPDEHDRAEGLSYILQFIANMLPMPNAESTFSFLITHILEFDGEMREEALRFITHAVMRAEDETRRNNDLALMMRVVSAHPNRHAREVGMRIVLSALSMGGGSSEEGGYGSSSEEGGYGSSSEEGGHGSSSEEGGHGSSSEEAGHGSSSEEGGHGSSSEEGGYGSSSEEGGYGSSSEEGGHGSSSEEGGHGSSSEEGGHGSSSEEGEYGSSSEEGGHGSSSEEGGHGSSSEEDGGGDDMEEFMRRLRQDEHERTAAIMEGLYHVAELGEEDENTAMAFFKWIIDSIMSLESPHDRAHGLGVVLEFIDHIDSEYEKGHMFEFLVKVLVGNDKREEAMRFLVHVIMQEPNEHERNEGIAYLIKLVYMHENEHEMNMALHAVLAAVSGGGGSDGGGDDDIEDFMRRLRRGGDERMRAIMEVLHHGKEIYDEDPTGSMDLFKWLIERIMTLDTQHDRFEGLGIVLEYVHSIESEEDQSHMFEFMVKVLVGHDKREEAMRFLVHVIMQEPNEHERNEGIAYLIKLVYMHENEHEMNMALHAVLTAVSDGGGSDGGGGDGDDMEEFMRRLRRGGDERRQAIREVWNHGEEIFDEDPNGSMELFKWVIDRIMSLESQHDRFESLGILLEYVDSVESEEDKNHIFAFMITSLLQNERREEGMRFMVHVIMEGHDMEERNQGLAFLIHVVSMHDDHHEREVGLAAVMSAISMSEDDGDDMEEFMRRLRRGGDERRQAIREVWNHGEEIFDEDPNGSMELFKWVIDRIMSLESQHDRFESLGILLEYVDSVESEEDKNHIFAFMITSLLQNERREEGMRFMVHVIMEGHDMEERNQGLAFLIHVVSMHDDHHEREVGLAAVMSAISMSEDDGDDMEEFMRRLRRGGDERRQAIREVWNHGEEIFDEDPNGSMELFKWVIDRIMSLESQHDRFESLGILLEYVDSVESEEDKNHIFAFMIQSLLQNERREEGMRFMVHVIMEGHDMEERNQGLAFLIHVVSMHEDDHERTVGLAAVMSAISMSEDDGDDMEEFMRRLRRGGDERRQAIREVWNHGEEIFDEDPNGSMELFKWVIDRIMSLESQHDRFESLGILLEYVDSVESEEDKNHIFAFMITSLLQNERREEGMRFMVHVIMEGHDMEERNQGLAFLIHVVSMHDDHHEREVGLAAVMSAISMSEDDGDDLEEFMRRLRRGGDERRQAIREVWNHGEEIFDEDPTGSMELFKWVIERIMSLESQHDRFESLGILLEYVDSVESEEDKNHIFAFMIKSLLENDRREESMGFLVHVMMEEHDAHKRNEGIAFLVNVVSHHEMPRERDAGLMAVFSALASRDDDYSDDQFDEIQEALRQLLMGPEGNRRAVAELLEALLEMIRSGGERGMMDMMGEWMDSRHGH